MKNRLIQMIAVITLIVIILLNFSTTLSLAALNDKYCNGYRIVKRYDDQDQAVYWITGKLVWKTTEMKFPAIADDNIPITAIYDNTKSSGVFQGHPWLEKADLSESRIELLGSYCFCNCKVLTTYINSPYLKEICGYAFQNANLNALELNDGLEKIRISAFENAFSDDKKLYVIDIPDSVTTIGENAFSVTNKNYRIVLVGKSGSPAEEYCRTDPKCTFIERGEQIPTEEELIEEEIAQEKAKIFQNNKFRYYNYNNTDQADKAYIFAMPATTLETSNLESFEDIIDVGDGLIAVGSSYLDNYKNSSSYSKYVEDTFVSKSKGDQDGIIVKYNYDIGMEWFKVFGGEGNDQFKQIYKTKDGGYLVFGKTCSVKGDLLGINNSTSDYTKIVVKYDSNFKMVETKLEKDAEDFINEIIEDEKVITNRKKQTFTTKSGKITLNPILDGDENIDVAEDLDTIIRKYDNMNCLEWSKIYDKDSKMTSDRLVKGVELDDSFIFVGSAFTQITNKYNKKIYVEDAIIVKYNKPYDQIIINGPGRYEMNIGEEKSVDVFYVPWEDVRIGEMYWTIENEDIAKVDYKGNITAIGEGTTIIRLDVRGKTIERQIRVTDPNKKHIEKIELDKTKLELVEGESQLLTVTITPKDTTDNTEIQWKSDNPEIAEVDSNGKVTAIKQGETRITATCGDFQVYCDVNVKKLVVEVAQIRAEPQFLEIKNGESYKIDYTIFPENATDKTIHFESSDPNSVYVDENGNVTALQCDKTATITLISNSNPDKKAYTEVTTLHDFGEWKVEKEPTWEAEGLETRICKKDNSHTENRFIDRLPKIWIESIETEEKTITMKKGDMKQLVISVLPEDASDKEVIYSSSNPESITVDKNGKITSLDCEKTARITIMAKENPEIKAGVEVKTEHDFGEWKVTKEPTYEEEGIKTRVCQKDSNHVETEKIPKLIKIGVTKVETEPRVVTLKKGETQQIKVTVLPKNATNKEIIYISSNPESISVDQNGKITALECEKTAKITIMSKENLGIKTEVEVKTEHDFGEWIVTKEATWAEDGMMKKVCRNDATHIEYQKIEKLNAPFKDLAKDAWYLSSIKYVVDKGLMNGYTGAADAEKFGPEDQITRGQIVTILYRKEGSLDVSGIDMKFDDIGPYYYYDAIKWASQNGIVTGHTAGENAGKFMPDDPITREQLALILQRYAKYKNISAAETGDLTGFKDYEQVSPWALEGLKWVVSKGIISGDLSTTPPSINPQGNATRAEAATMIMRFCENVK